MVIDFDNHDLTIPQREWLKLGITLCVVRYIPDAIRELTERGFLFVAVFHDTDFDLRQLDILQKIRSVTILLYPPEYNVTKRTVDFFSGADAFFGLEQVSPEIIHALIPLFKQLERRIDAGITPIRPHHHRDIFMVVEYRKLYVRGREVELGRAEFDILELLLSEPGRVYTYEQIYNYAQGETASPESVIAAVHSYIKRIRHRIEVDDTSPGYIQSVRSVGYRLALS